MSDERLTRVSVRTLIALVMVLTAAAYWRGAFTFFAVDDYVYFANTHWTIWKNAFEFFTYPRGLTEATFVLHRWLFGYQPLLFHIVPFALHVVNALLVYRLIRWALPEHELAAAIGTLLFTVHPAAYTPMAWLSQGFETVPCLTLSLCAAHLFVAHLERRGRFSLLAAVILMIAAIAFKNNVVLFPAYAGSLGLIFVSRASAGRDRMRAVLRVAIALIPVALFDLWFAWEIMWRLPHLSHPAYARDLSPASLAKSYEQLLLHTFNVLPIFRHAIGYQDAIPAGFSPAGIGAGLYRGVLLAVGIAIGVIAVRRGQIVFAISMAAIVVGGLSFATPLSHHLQDYYSYFVIPAACALLAFPLALIIEPLWRRMKPRGRILAAGALVLHAFATGTVLHPANGVIRQAATAQAVDEFVRTSAGANQELVFLPPNAGIEADLASGLSLKVLHPGKNVTVRFPSISESQSQPLSRSIDRTLLVSVNDFAGRGPRVYKLDTVQLSDAGIGPYLRAGQQVVQRFEVHGDGLSEVHVRLEHFGGAASCEVTARLFELTSPALQGARVPIGSNTLPCSDDGFQIVPVAGQQRSAGKTYELELSAADASTPRLFHVAPTPPGFVPLVESSAKAGKNGENREDGAQPEARVLAFRVVMDGVDLGTRGIPLSGIGGTEGIGGIGVSVSAVHLTPAAR
jgi:hypothetical protein